MQIDDYHKIKYTHTSFFHATPVTITLEYENYAILGCSYFYKKKLWPCVSGANSILGGKFSFIAKFNICSEVWWQYLDHVFCCCGDTVKNSVAENLVAAVHVSIRFSCVCGCFKDYVISSPVPLPNPRLMSHAAVVSGDMASLMNTVTKRLINRYFSVMILMGIFQEIGWHSKIYGKPAYFHIPLFVFKFGNSLRCW